MNIALAHALASAFREGADGRLAQVTVPAPPGLWSKVLSAASPFDDEPRTFWAGRDPSEGIWVGRGAARIVEAEGPGRFQKLQNLTERLFLSIQFNKEYSDRLRVFGGGAFFEDDRDSAATRALGNATFVLPRLTYVDAGSESTLSYVGDGGDLEEVGSFLRSFEHQEGAPRAGRVPPVLEVDPGVPDAFEDSVRSIQLGILRGEVDKVVLARRVRLLLSQGLDLAAVLSSLLESGPDSVRFALARGSKTFLGATPERLVRVSGLELETDALAGTVPKNRQGARESLLGSVKDRHEHSFVVRAIREALEPLAAELRIAEEPDITELPQLFHLRTRVRARLRDKHHALDVVDRLHPTPAVGGFPRPAALGFLREHESEARGWYAGPFGWVDPSGDGEFVVALRSAFVDGQVADLFAGAGIVEGSDPAAEFDETELKLGRMLGALGLSATGRETGSWQPAASREAEPSARQA